jgi:hypothetical protein
MRALFGTRRRCIGTLGVLTILALAAPSAAIGSARQQTAQENTARAAAPPACTNFSATNAYAQTRVVTTNNDSHYTSTSWTTLACGVTTVTVPRGRRGLVVAKVDAEVTCTGTDGSWCQGRVLLDGVEGQPNAPEPDSFSWANSEPNANQWESNAFTRTRELRCPRSHGSSVCSFRVVTQVRNHASGLDLRVDDSTLHVQVTYV